MRDRLTAIIAIFLLLVLIGASYWYSVQAKKDLYVHLSDLDSPDFIAHDTTVTFFDKDGSAKAKIFTVQTMHYTDGHAQAVAPRYYSLNPNMAQITARSDYAKMVDSGQVIHFLGNVVLTQDATSKRPESKLETSQLDMYPDTNEYKSDKPVKITRGHDVSTGIGMDYDNVDRTFKLRSQVQTTILPNTVKNSPLQ
ncbi:MAG: LPS export ABC transporter periplasmic protein LptC [Burkholderiaceae bacterium]|nr:LPS export ABC transporter periplasmic protein LptC [Burkholderiaceae bacterium]